LILVSLTTAVLSYPYLPENVPMHWNINGQVDNYEPKERAVFFMPSLVIVMWVLFWVLPKIDPKKDKYKLFLPEWLSLQTIFLGFFVYLQLLTIYTSINPKFDFMSLMFVGMGLMFFAIGNFLPKIRQNYFLGIKIPWTLTNENNWNKTHRFGGWCFMLSGMMLIVQGMLKIFFPALVFWVLMVMMFLPIVYSYSIFLKTGKDETSKRLRKPTDS
jgi:uncharacterized membrane protein